MTETARRRSLSFGAEAAAYERGRPSYPPEAIDWLLPDGARRVLDLGAGTGKLTTRLAERGLDVVAVDPVPEMLELLTRSLPDTPALLGTAEEIPLPDDRVDAVLVAQAWHWFDAEAAEARTSDKPGLPPPHIPPSLDARPPFTSFFPLPPEPLPFPSPLHT